MHFVLRRISHPLKGEKINDKISIQSPWGGSEKGGLENRGGALIH